MKKVGLFLAILVSVVAPAQALPKTFAELAAAVDASSHNVVMGELINGLAGLEVAISDLSKAGVTPRGILCWGDDYSELDLPGFGREVADKVELYPWSARVLEVILFPKVESEARNLYGSSLPLEALTDLRNNLKHPYYVGCEINLVDSYSSTGSFGGGTLHYVIDTEGTYGFYIGSYWFE